MGNSEPAKFLPFHFVKDKDIYLKFYIDKYDMDFLINSSEYHWNVTINASQSGDLSGW